MPHWYHQNPHGQLVPGTCFVEIVREAYSMQLQINFDEFNGMFGEDCGCLNCRQRRLEYEQEQQQRGLAGRCPTLQRGSQADAPQGREAQNTAAARACPTLERGSQADAPQGREAPLKPFVPRTNVARQGNTTEEQAVSSSTNRPRTRPRSPSTSTASSSHVTVTSSTSSSASTQ